MVASRSAETGARRRITEPKGDGVDLRRPGTWRWNAAAGSLTKHLDALSHKVQSTVVTLQLVAGRRGSDGRKKMNKAKIDDEPARAGATLMSLIVKMGCARIMRLWFVTRF